MSKSSATNEQYSSEPRRRLSPWRVMLAVFILVSLPAGTVFALQKWHASQPTVSNKPWFASYVDVTATPTFAFEQLGTTSNRDAVLSFIVSSPMDACTPSWGAFTSRFFIKRPPEPEEPSVSSSLVSCQQVVMKATVQEQIVP
jgi:hypothetical protein